MFQRAACRRYALLLPVSAWMGTSVASAASYLIVDPPWDLDEQVQSLGGTVEAVYPFGVAVVQSDDLDLPNRIAGARLVMLDRGFEVESPTQEVALEAGVPPASGDDDFFFDLQWGHNYVGAQDAWMAGVTGDGVRVAVLDTGFDLDHPDLAPNINLALSQDFTGEGLEYGLPGAFSHGSHVAGTIAAADNGLGTIGVAPDAELVLVKVLSDFGTGSYADIIAGIYHAANVGADVINMSLGELIARNGGAPSEVTELAVAVNAAITYAYQMGSTVIVSAGNTSDDLDGDGNRVRFMTGMSHAIGISALTPLNWATDQGQSLVAASYTNFGTSMVDFSAPGGSADYPGNEVCVVAGQVQLCRVFDLVFSVGNGGWYWSGGTSMAAPHATGVAALIISANGGDMHPARVASKMRQYATDLGKRGRDDFYGHGQVRSGY